MEPIILAQKILTDKTDLILKSRLTNEERSKLEETSHKLRNKLNLRAKRKMHLVSEDLPYVSQKISVREYLSCIQTPEETPQKERKKLNVSVSNITEMLPTVMSPERDQLLEIAAQLSVPPDSWTTLEPTSRMNRIAQLRKFVLNGMDKNSVQTEQLHNVSNQ